MGRLDGEQMTAAIGALVKRDIALAKRIIATDDQVDALQRAIEEKAVATIVLERSATLQKILPSGCYC
jgi:phosphate transport system protein